MAADDDQDTEGGLRSGHGQGDGESVRERDVRGGHRKPVGPQGSAEDSSGEPDPSGLERGGREPKRRGGSEDVSGPVQEPLVPLSEIPSRYAATFHQGPLPAPEDLARYGELQPDLVNRIVGMAEQDLAARIDSIRSTSRAEAFAVRAGAVAAVAIPVLLVVVAVALALAGLDPIASAIIGASGPVLFGIARVIDAARGRGAGEDAGES